ncbi:MAG: portal protein, partial [Leptospiraceae bacterium]|nr:portal protein [Leptospiraceae bacterium]
MGEFRITARNYYSHSIREYAKILFGLFGTLSILTLILEFGFYYPSELNSIIKFINSSIINYMLFYEFLVFLFHYENYRHYWKERKTEATIAILVIIQKIFYKDIIFFFETMQWVGIDAETAPLAFLALNQGFFFISNLASFLRSTRLYYSNKLNPSFMFFISFAAIIIVGILFLAMPKMHNKPIAFIDLLFTVISATCVTGLSTIDISDALSFRGQLVLMFLIQVGGLGLITLTSFFSIFLAGQASVSDTLMMKDLLSEEAIGRVKKLIRDITLQTIIIETLGAIYLYFTFPPNLKIHGFSKFFFCVFHSVSAFCNAGFSLLSYGFADERVWNEKLFLSGIMFLIVFGGLGFSTTQDLYRKAIIYKKQHYRLSVSTKLGLIVYSSLFVLGSIAYFNLEEKYTLKDFNLEDKLFHSIFYSITTRTAGFNTLDLSKMGEVTVFFSLLLMWVGASPNSTGGGIKTTTLAISFLQIYGYIRGTEKLEVFNRNIPRGSIRRASITIVLSLFIIFTAIFGLMLNEKFPFIDICYEVVSAYGTVGLSRGLTPHLSSASKIYLCFVMFAGRVGILTILIAMIPKHCLLYTS